MRNKRYFAVILLLSLLLSGCIRIDPASYNLDTMEFYANIKADADADSGKKAACFGGRVWYLSAESGTQGVHSMAADGSDVRLEFATEDIRALTVREDGAWYAGFQQTAEDNGIAYRRFRPYARMTASDAAHDLLSGLSAAQMQDMTETNVWGLYVASDGTVAIQNVNVNWKGVGAYFLLLRNGALVEVEEPPPIIAKYWQPEGADNSFAEIMISRFSPFLNVSRSGTFVRTAQCRTAFLSDNLYDEAANRIAFPYDLLVNTYYTDDYSPWYLFRVEGDVLGLLSNEELYFFDRATEKGRSFAKFERPERIFGCYDAGSELYVLTERVNWWPLRNVLGRTNREMLYRVDMETGEKVRLLQLGPGAAIVYLDGATAVTASRQTLTVYDLSGELPAVSRTVALAHKVVDKANKADTAGGWWFLYRFNEETGRDELIEKVRLDG